MPDLVIRNLRASIDGAEILKGIDLELSKGEIHAIMGPNGSGKSTLAGVLAGRDSFEVTEGSVTFEPPEVVISYFRNASTTAAARLSCASLAGDADKVLNVMLDDSKP